MWKNNSVTYNKEKASNAFFGTKVNKSVYFFMCGFRLTFAVFMDRDLPNSFSVASFIRETLVQHYTAFKDEKDRSFDIIMYVRYRTV
jgi:hypothetical protein